MRKPNRKFGENAVRGLTILAACATLGTLTAGCAKNQVDKYTVSDADRKAAAGVYVDQKNALPGGELQQTNTGAKPAPDAKTP